MAAVLHADEAPSGTIRPADPSDLGERHRFSATGEDAVEARWYAAARAVDAEWNRTEGGYGERVRLRRLIVSPGFDVDGSDAAATQVRARLFELSRLVKGHDGLHDEIVHFGFDPRDMAGCYLRHWTVPADAPIGVPAGSLCVYSRDATELQSARLHPARISSFTEGGKRRFGQNRYRFTFFAPLKTRLKRPPL